MKNNKQDINGIDELLIKEWKITRKVSRYKVEHFFGKLKKGFKCFIIINDKTLKNYYSFTHIDTSFILLGLGLWKIIYKIISNNLILRKYLKLNYLK